MSEELIPTNRQEKIMSDTIRALNGDDVTDALVPGWDDEYFLDNILKAAQGEDPQYNLEPRWHHQKFYKAIAEAIAESGGGGSPWTLVASKEFTVNTSSTSVVDVGTIDCGSALAQGDKLIFTIVRDKAGKRAGYFYGGYNICLNYEIKDTPSAQPLKNIVSNAMYGQDANSKWYNLNNAYGVYVKSVNCTRENASATVSARYYSTLGTIDGTYLVEIYTLDFPNGLIFLDGLPIT